MYQRRLNVDVHTSDTSDVHGTVACSRLLDSGEDAKVKTFFPCAKFTRQVLCSFLRAPMCGKSRKHSFNTEVIVDFSISRAWTPHAIFLSDRKDPLWECWYNLSNLTNQRVYQELVYRNGSFKEMITGSAASSQVSFLPFYNIPKNTTHHNNNNNHTSSSFWVNWCSPDFLLIIWATPITWKKQIQKDSLKQADELLDMEYKNTSTSPSWLLIGIHRMLCVL